MPLEFTSIHTILALPLFESVIIMSTTNPYLFVYGTLLTTGNPYAHYLQKHCSLVGAAKLKGILYDIGEYPGAVINLTGDQYIYGSTYLMNDAAQVLKVIDEYEGIGPNETLPHEYERVLVEVEGDIGVFTCWVYIYNWSISEKRQIPGGNYSQYINVNNRA